MQVRYTEGPESRVIPAARAVVARGEWVDLPDDIASGLVAQGWEQKKKPTKTEAADRGEED